MLLGLLAAAAPTVRVEGRLSVSLVMTAGAVAMVWIITRASGPTRAIGLAVVAGAVLAGTNWSIGRAPAIVTAVNAGLVGAVWATPDAATRHRRWTAAVVAAFAVAQAVWVWQLPNRTYGVAAGSTAALLALRDRARLWSRLVAATGPLVEGARRRGRPLVVATRTAARRGRRSVGSATRATGRALRVDRRQPVLVGLVSALLFAPLIHHFVVDRQAEIVTGYNDFVGHLKAARELTWSPFVVPPHALFHVSVWLLEPILGRFAATVVLCTAVALGGIGLTRLARRRTSTDPGLGWGTAWVLAAVGTLGESPSALLFAVRGQARSVRDLFGPVRLWGSPTEIVSTGTTLLLLPMLLDVVDPPDDEERRPTVAALAIASLVASVAKPGFTLVALGALPVLMFLRRRTLPTDAIRRLSLGFGLPVVVLSVAQGVVISRVLPAEHRGGVAFDPLTTWHLIPPSRGGWTYFLVLALPVACLALAPRRYVRDPAVALAWLSLLAATAALLLFAETGQRAKDGNIAKLGTVPLTLVWITSARFALAQLSGRGNGPAGALRRAVVALVMASSVAAGVTVYGDAMQWWDLPRLPIGFPTTPKGDR